MRSIRLRRSATAIAIALAVGGSFQLGRSVVGDAYAAPPSVAPVATSVGALPDFRTIAERLGPAVVNIAVEGTVRTATRSRIPQVPPGLELPDFFKRFGPLQPPGSERNVRGQGSGFIVSSDGVILTNAHVVDNATTVTVRLTDRREYPARVVGIDGPSDVAVLQIDAEDLPTVPLGDPDSVHVGDWVLAIGSPFGFENSVTAGIVSARSRSLPDEGYVPFIQTDVAINPGNSGGPLINMAGEVIGINSQIYSRSGGYQGLSFAIPIDVAAGIRDQLLADGRVTRGRMGVGIQDLNQALAESFGLESAGGALVTQVEKDSPAERAGLHSGDVILELDGTAVTRSAELPPKVAAMKPGSEAGLTVWRDGKRIHLAVEIGRMEGPTVVSTKAGEADQARLGLALRPLTDDERRRSGVDEGLLVLEVAGPASRAGIRPGDVVLALNGRAVGDVESLRKLLDGVGKHVALLVQRADARIFVPVEIG
ncbi:MAG: DegQ family serine endoprotease [Rhodocyclaceae bacterium]|nr:DegQ family serine endoprotease [Rhodocyclaceae bacterium]